VKKKKKKEQQLHHEQKKIWVKSIKRNETKRNNDTANNHTKLTKPKKISNHHTALNLPFIVRGFNKKQQQDQPGNDHDGF